ncbi:MAG: hypothetical protein WC934_06865 [Acidithiobacillus sp.]|jgi:hypothetical protein
MAISIPSLQKIQVFEIYCQKCKKNRELHAKEGYIGTKEISYITCICGNQISVEILKYLFRTRDFIEDIDYFIY